jgi:hypothetical protein
MSRFQVARSAASFDVGDHQPSIDRMLRSGLLKVYPLPVDYEVAEERFCALLEALEKRCGDNSQ